MSILTDTKEQFDDFRKLTSDVSRWKWVIDLSLLQRKHNIYPTFAIVLDIDQTFITFKNIDSYWSFDEPLGFNAGIKNLLDAHHIESQFT